MLLFTEEFADLVADEPLVYVDAGARGGLEGPWAEVDDDRLRIIAFEPDAEGCAKLQRARGPRVDAVAKALWSAEGAVDVHLASVRSTSSVHPPNAPLLARYAVEHSAPRATEKIASVPCTTLDRALSELGVAADFLKIDTQGSEYEILVGARDSLRDSIIGVLTETWTTEVHRGQKLSGDILCFMHQYGFELFDMNIAAAWWRKESGPVSVRGKRQITGLDLLFFKDPPIRKGEEATPAKVAKIAAIAELYGFPDFALEILDGFTTRSNAGSRALRGLRRKLVHSSVEKRRGWVEKLRSRLTPNRRPIKLHY